MSGIIRVKKDARYFTASNEPFNDVELSWEARGVMGYLLSKPDGWEIRNWDLINKGPAGEHKIKRILGELKSRGYIHRYRQHKTNGTFEWVTEVYESPSLNPHRQDDEESDTTDSVTIGRLSTDGSPTDGSSIDGKPHHIVNTKSVSTDLAITKTTMPTGAKNALPHELEPDPENSRGRRSFSSDDLKMVSNAYENEIGFITQHTSEIIKDWLQTYPPGWIVDAIKTAVENNVRKPKYISAILANWQRDGRNDGHKKANGASSRLTTEQLEALRQLRAESERSRRKD